MRTHALYTNIIEPQAQSLLEGHVVFQDSCVELSLTSVENVSPLVISELCRLIFERLDVPQRDVTAFHYNTLLKRIYSQRGRLTLPGDVEVVTSGKVLKFGRPSVQAISPDSEIELLVNGTTLFDNFTLTSRVVSIHACSVTQSTDDKHTECFDMDKLVLPLYVRARQTGDRFTPLGKRQPVKVGKFPDQSKSGEVPKFTDCSGV